MTVTGYAKSTIRLVAVFILAGYSTIRAATFLDSIPLDTIPQERAFVLGRVDGHLNVFYIARGALFRHAVGDGMAGGAVEICKTPRGSYSLCFREGVLAMSSSNRVGPRGRLVVFDSRNGFSVLLDTSIQDHAFKDAYVDDGKVYALIADTGIGIFDYQNNKPFRVHSVFEDLERIRATGGLIFNNSYGSSRVQTWRPDGDTLAYLGDYAGGSGTIEIEVQGDSLLVTGYDRDSRWITFDMVRYEGQSGFDTVKVVSICLPGSEPLWHRGRLYYVGTDGLYAFAEDLKIPIQDTAVPSARILKARHGVSGGFAFSGDTLAMMESVPDGDFLRPFINFYRIGDLSGLIPRFRARREKGSQPAATWLANGRKRNSGGNTAGKTTRRSAAIPVFGPAP